jgi:hypothetical protein
VIYRVFNGPKKKDTGLPRAHRFRLDSTRIEADTLEEAITEVAGRWNVENEQLLFIYSDVSGEGKLVRAQTGTTFENVTK